MEAEARRRFPPRWTVEERRESFIVRDGTRPAARLSQPDEKKARLKSTGIRSALRLFVQI